jgi:UDP-glucuronate 4-epimerase
MIFFFMKFLVTGAAGFIGFHTSQYLLKRGDTVIGIDNLNDYYDSSLKEARLSQLITQESFKFHKIDLIDKKAIDELFKKESPEYVINLAAQAGVRYSLENPYAYIDSNITGFINILEACRDNPVRHLVFASSSSVYGANKQIPFSIEDKIVSPVSLYGATKASNELLAYSYNHLFNIPMTALRFFTVYGPWGRPDMAYFKFTRSILNGDSIDVFNNGEHARDFTYIDDIVAGVVSSVDRNIDDDNDFRIYNLGNNKPVELMQFIETLENIMGKKAELNMLPMQKGDVEKTYADIELSMKELNYSPKTDVASGLARFVEWFKDYY